MKCIPVSEGGMDSSFIEEELSEERVSDTSDVLPVGVGEFLQDTRKKTNSPIVRNRNPDEIDLESMRVPGNTS